MKRPTKLIIAAVAAVTLALGLSACTSGSTASASDSSKAEVDAKAAERAPYLPTNDVEYDNYNRAQELYDSPDSIIWCTTTWGNASAPIITVPIAGKLTSSSVSYYPGTSVQEYGFSDTKAYVSEENRSVDGMYHGSPGPYRYGFTPGGQYVDFTNLEVFCTTSLTEFQRQSTTVSVDNGDAEANALQAKAEEALAAGDPIKATELLSGLAK